jgi:hypothetical protein
MRTPLSPTEQAVLDRLDQRYDAEETNPAWRESKPEASTQRSKMYASSL